MTQDQIERPAFEAWITQDGAWPQAARLTRDGTAYAVLSTHTAWGVWQAATAAERERCAAIAEATVCDQHIPTGIKIYGTRAAKAIRGAA